MGYAPAAQNRAELSAVAQPQGLPSPLPHMWTLAPWGTSPGGQGRFATAVSPSFPSHRDRAAQRGQRGYEVTTGI